MSIDLNRVLRPKAIANELKEIDEDFSAIANLFPDEPEHVLRKRVYAALWLPISATGIASRMILRHSTYLRYWTPIKSFVVYDRRSKKSGEWRPVPQRNMSLLVESAASQMTKEVSVIEALVDAGRIDRTQNRYADIIDDLRLFVSRNGSIKADILDALEVVLAENYRVTGLPVIETEEARLAKRIANPKLQKPKAKPATARNLDF